MQSRSNGKYIAIEGIDGSGKGTQIELTQEYLRKKLVNQNDSNIKYVEIFNELDESTPLGKKIRKELHSNQFFNPTRHDLFMVHLFITNRIERIFGNNGVQSKLSRNILLLQDRSLLSTFAYSKDISFDLLWELHKDLIFPDIIYLDISPEESMKRIINRQKDYGVNLEKYESLEKLYSIKNNYQKAIDYLLKKGVNIVSIDVNNKQIQEVQEQIHKHINI